MQGRTNCEGATPWNLPAWAMSAISLSLFASVGMCTTCLTEWQRGSGCVSLSAHGGLSRAEHCTLLSSDLHVPSYALTVS